jgi:hypothetical protein
MKIVLPKKKKKKKNKKKSRVDENEIRLLVVQFRISFVGRFRDESVGVLPFL